MLDDALAYPGGPFDVAVERVDDNVTIRILRDGKALVQIDTNRKGAVGLVQKILGALA
jgi:hypothetical protein